MLLGPDATRDASAHSTSLPRVTLLGTEYQRAIIASELAWVRGVVDDLRTDALTWSDELVEVAKSDLPR